MQQTRLGVARLGPALCITQNGEQFGHPFCNLADGCRETQALHKVAPHDEIESLNVVILNALREAAET